MFWRFYKDLFQFSLDLQLTVPPMSSFIIIICYIFQTMICPCRLFILNAIDYISNRSSSCGSHEACFEGPSTSCYAKKKSRMKLKQRRKKLDMFENEKELM